MAGTTARPQAETRPSSVTKGVLERGAQSRRAPCGQGEATPELVHTRVRACGILRVTARLPGCGAGGVAFVHSSLFTRSCPDACETLPGGQWNTGRFSPIFPASGLGQLLGDARSEARTDRNHGSGLGARRGPPSPPRPAPSALGPSCTGLSQRARHPSCHPPPSHTTSPFPQSRGQEQCHLGAQPSSVSPEGGCWKGTRGVCVVAGGLPF